VKLIVTGRPQTEALFAAWTPKRIEPGSQHNLADMRQLLESRLEKGKFVADAETQAAVQVMLGKSQVRFIAGTAAPLYCQNLFMGTETPLCSSFLSHIFK